MLNKLKNVLRLRWVYRKYSELLSFRDFLFIHKRNSSSGKVNLLGKEFSFTNGFWFRHSLREIFIDQTYKFKTNKSSPLILDCGANIGLSVLYFKKNYPNCKIIAFEPDKDISGVLLSNIANNSIKNVRVIQKAVWINEDNLHFQSDGALGGKITSRPEGITVPAVRLKDFLNQEIALLKIDIEGAEYEVIKDCENELHNVKNIFIEYHSLPNEKQMLDEILTILSNSGFKYYIKEAWENQKIPFMETKGPLYDLQLNIFGKRI